MKQQKLRVAACGIAAVLTFAGMDITASAAGGISDVLPSAGVTLTLADNTTTLQTIKDSAANSTENTTETKKIENTQTIEELKAEVGPIEKELTPEEAEEESFKNLVIAQVTNYVNVRSTPSEDGEIVGKLYDKSVGTFISEKDGWYEINSGSVTGYVKGEFCVTGEDAVALAKEVGTRIATVTTTTLYVRQEPTVESSVIGMVPIEDDLIVTEELDGWVKVNIEEGDGYVSKDYVTLTTEFVKAESKAEEEARLAKEEAERQAAREAARAAEAARASKSTNTQTTTVTASGGSGTGTSVANYALQFVGNPYVYGGSSLTNGTDCSGFVMSVYANYGVSLPHSSSSLRSSGSGVEGGLSATQPGDIICYSGHVGIYIGNGQIVHASTSKTGIIVSNADYRQVLAVRRIF